MGRPLVKGVAGLGRSHSIIFLIASYVIEKPLAGIYGVRTCDTPLHKTLATWEEAMMRRVSRGGRISSFYRMAKAIPEELGS